MTNNEPCYIIRVCDPNISYTYPIETQMARAAHRISPSLTHKLSAAKTAVTKHVKKYKSFFEQQELPTDIYVFELDKENQTAHVVHHYHISPVQKEPKP